MNWQHFQTFVWLRWRLLVNQWRRGGTISAWLMIIISTCILAVAIPLGIGCIFLGYYALPAATSEQLLYLWDAVVVSFISFWCIGVFAELQRTETLSLSKFLHLPVSPKNAFLINYVSTLVSLSLIVFMPALLGLTFGISLAKGPLFLLIIPSIVAFFLMVTGVTYQFQGWLASLMSNPRRRRTVIMVTTMVFILIFQMPNLLNFLGRSKLRDWAKQSEKMTEELSVLDREYQLQVFDAKEYLRRQQEIMKKYPSISMDSLEETKQRAKQTAWLANLVIPIGWLPVGVMTISDGVAWPALLGCIGMSLIGFASLVRSYRTTLRLYRGEFTSRQTKKATFIQRGEQADKAKSIFIEARLPGVSEPVSAIAIAGLQSLVRSPEGKMMLVTPLLLSFVFGSALWRNQDMPAGARILVGIAAIMVSMFGMAQMACNQFGFDRDGFRVFVLSSARRRDILLGKNLAFAPLLLGTSTIMMMFVQYTCPMRITHLLAMVPQFISMFLLFCMVTNLMSIYAPMPIAAGSLKPANPKIIPMLLQMVTLMVFFPLIQLPTLLPFGIEALIEWQGGNRWPLPILLLLATIESAAVAFCYVRCLSWQGGLLQAREQRILEVVTSRAA